MPQRVVLVAGAYRECPRPQRRSSVPTIEQDVPNVRAVTEQKVTRMLTFIAARQPEVTAHFHGLMIDRGAFDRMLAHEAAWNGADCRYGETVLSIDIEGTVTTSAGARLRPRVLIGADGPHSRIGAAIGAINRNLVDTRQVTVPLVLPYDATDIFLSADYRGGYAWLFPKGAVANVGLGVAIESRRSSSPCSLRFAQGSPESVASGRRAFALTGGAIPVGGRLRSIGRLEYTAVRAGDAAGLTNPVTGAGIASAVQSGELAGHAAVLWLPVARPRSTSMKKSLATFSTLRLSGRCVAAAP